MKPEVRALLQRVQHTVQFELWLDPPKILEPLALPKLELRYHTETTTRYNEQTKNYEIKTIFMREGP